MKKYWLLIFLFVSLQLFGSRTIFQINDKITDPDQVYYNRTAYDNGTLFYICIDSTQTTNSDKYQFGSSNVYQVIALKGDEKMIVGKANSYSKSGYMDPSCIKITDKYIIVNDSDVSKLNFYSKAKPYTYSHSIRFENPTFISPFDIHGKYLFTSSCPNFKEESNSLHIYEIKKTLFSDYSLKKVKSIINMREPYLKCKTAIDSIETIRKLIEENSVVFDSNILYNMTSSGAYQNTFTILSEKEKIAVPNFGEKIYFLDSNFEIADSIAICEIIQLHNNEFSKKQILKGKSWTTFTQCNNIVLNKNGVLALSFALSAHSIPESGEKMLVLYFDTQSRKMIKSEYTNSLIISIDGEFGFINTRHEVSME
jgi:hypothetical protein